MKKVEIYTDGACSVNPGVGGWGAVLFYNNHKKEISGSEPETTNNRMELMAIIQGLLMLKFPCEVTIYSDSAYAVNAFNEGWIYNWIKLGWRTAKKEDVKNVDLWQQLFELTKTHKVNFVKVKGHSDNEYNNRCDYLATSAVEKLQKKLLKKKLETSN